MLHRYWMVWVQEWTSNIYWTYKITCVYGSSLWYLTGISCSLFLPHHLIHFFVFPFKLFINPFTFIILSCSPWYFLLSLFPSPFYCSPASATFTAHSHSIYIHLSISFSVCLSLYIYIYSWSHELVITLWFGTQCTTMNSSLKVYTGGFIGGWLHNHISCRKPETKKFKVYETV